MGSTSTGWPSTANTGFTQYVSTLTSWAANNVEILRKLNYSVTFQDIRQPPARPSLCLMFQLHIKLGVAFNSVTGLWGPGIGNRLHTDIFDSQIWNTESSLVVRTGTIYKPLELYYQSVYNCYCVFAKLQSSSFSIHHIMNLRLPWLGLLKSLHFFFQRFHIRYSYFNVTWMELDIHVCDIGPVYAVRQMCFKLRILFTSGWFRCCWRWYISYNTQGCQIAKFSLYDRL